MISLSHDKGFQCLYGQRIGIKSGSRVSMRSLLVLPPLQCFELLAERKIYIVICSIENIIVCLHYNIYSDIYSNIYNIYPC